MANAKTASPTTELVMTFTVWLDIGRLPDGIEPVMDAIAAADPKYIAVGFLVGAADGSGGGIQIVAKTVGNSQKISGFLKALGLGFVRDFEPSFWEECAGKAGGSYWRYVRDFLRRNTVVGYASNIPAEKIGEKLKDPEWERALGKEFLDAEKAGYRMVDFGAWLTSCGLHAADRWKIKLCADAHTRGVRRRNDEYVNIFTKHE